MQLVFFGLEPFEKSLYASPTLVTVDDRVLLIIVEINVGLGHGDLCRRRIFQQLLLCPCMLRACKRFDRTILYRQQRIRNDEVVIDADSVPETLAHRAGTKRGIETEEM